MSSELRIVIADASPLVQAGLTSVVEEAGIDVVAVCDDAEQARAASIAAAPDAVLLAAHLPGGAVETIEHLGAHMPRTECVVLAEHDDPALMLRMVRAGAHGFLLAGTDPERLPHAIAGVVAGEAAIPRRLVRAMADELARGDRRRRDGRTGGVLTARELDVLEALADGDAPAVVARGLGISASTVRRHVANAVRKLGVADRAAAIRIVGER